MKSHDLSIFKCPECHKQLVLAENIGESSIFKCSCFEYLQFYGIFYLNKNQAAREAIKLLRSGKSFLAFKTLLGVRYKLFLPLYILLKFKISRILGFSTTLDILSLFSFKNSWVKYLKKREIYMDFNISKNLLLNLNRSKLRIIDIGCGTGNLFTFLNSSGLFSHIVGVDISFINLCIAKFFFAKNVVLVCCDVQKPLPFTNNYFDIVHLNGVIQDFKNKEGFVNNINVILHKSGSLFIIHTNQNKKSAVRFPISSKKMIKYLKINGFKKVSAFNDELLMTKIIAKDFDFTESEAVSQHEDIAYSIVASRQNNLNMFIKMNKINEFIFVSPHLDDVVLSASNLIALFHKIRINVKVFTVFTEASEPPYSDQAKEHLELSGFTNANKLFQRRKIEDRNAMSLLGVNYKHLGFIDAAWRKDSKGDFHYKNNAEQYSGRAVEKDNILVGAITSRLEKLIPNNKIVLLLPLGIGNHVDHIITRKAVEALKNSKIYWEDFPYNLNKINLKNYFTNNNSFDEVVTIASQKPGVKVKAVAFYKSQLKVLFQNEDPPNIYEKYYQRN